MGNNNKNKKKVIKKSTKLDFTDLADDALNFISDLAYNSLNRIPGGIEKNLSKLSSFSGITPSSPMWIPPLFEQALPNNTNVFQGTPEQFPGGGDVSFETWYKTVPPSKNDTTNYNLRRAYDLAPKEQLNNFVNNPDSHLYSVYENPQTGIYEFLKSKNHPTINKELEWYNSNSKDAINFRKKYKLDTTEDYYKYIPIKKFPAGGYLNYQEGYKGFGTGPELYQDNSYFRTIVPDNIEDMDAMINEPSIFSTINNVLGTANQVVNAGTGLMSKFNMSNNLGSNLTMDNLGGSQGIQIPGATLLDNLNPSQTQNMMWNMSSPKFTAPIAKDGGMVPKFAGGGLAEIYGNSYGGNTNNPRIYNSNSNRATVQDLQRVRRNDFLNTKVRKDRQSFEDDKVDWGFMNWAKEPVGATLGVLSTVPGVGNIVDGALGDSFLTRTGGYTVGSGVGNTAMGTAKIIGGIGTGNVGMVSSGIGDVGEGVGSTVGTFQAKDSLASYDKSGYISGNRLVNASKDFGNMMDTAGSLFGNVKGGVDMFGKSGNFGNIMGNMKGGQKGVKGFGNFMSNFVMAEGGNINSKKGWLDQL
jgi:hypothetical protein